MTVSVVAFAALMFVGCVLRDDCDTAGCSLVDPKFSSLKQMVQVKVDDCLGNKVMDIRSTVGNHNVTVVDAVRTFCSQRSEIVGCWDRLERQTEVCLTARERTEIRYYRGFGETLMDEGCVQDGERLVVIFEHEQSPSSRTLANLFKNLEPFADENPAGPNSAVLHEFRKLREIRKCLKSHPQDDLVTAALSLTEDILGKAQCVHPDDGSLVLCNTISSEEQDSDSS